MWPDGAAPWRNVDRWPAGAARARAVEVFQRLNALDPAAVAAEELTPEAVPFLRFAAAAQEVFDAWRAALGRKPALYSVGHCRRLWEVYSAVTITSHLFGAYLKCSTKCFFRLLGEAAAETGNAYANWVQTQTEAYHSEGLKRLMEGVPCDERAIRPSGTGHLKTANWRLAGEFVARSENL